MDGPRIFPTADEPTAGTRQEAAVLRRTMRADGTFERQDEARERYTALGFADALPTPVELLDVGYEPPGAQQRRPAARRSSDPSDDGLDQLSNQRGAEG